MKHINEFLKEQQVNESFADMWNIAGGIVLYDALIALGTLGIGGALFTLVNYWEKTGTKINKKQRELIENVLSFAKGNNDCPKYNKFVDELQNNDLSDGIQYSITDIIKELVNVVETDEQKEGLKELIKLQCKQLTSTRNKYVETDSYTWAKELNQNNKQTAEELKEIAKSL